MTTDYDVRRGVEIDPTEDASLAALAGRRRSKLSTADSDVDDGDAVQSFELPEADVFGEELSVRVIPKQPNEFMCSRCFLVQHNSRIALRKYSEDVCGECQ
jgi:Domain of unknown function (DUF4193)